MGQNAHFDFICLRSLKMLEGRAKIVLRSSKTHKLCKMVGKPKESQRFSGVRMALDSPKKAPRSLQDGFETASDHAGALGRGLFRLVHNGTKRT